jgi:hypothetical protein
MWEMRNLYKFLIGRPELKRSLGRPKYRMSLIKWVLKIEFEVLDWTHLVQDRVQCRAFVNEEVNLPAP